MKTKILTFVFLLVLINTNGQSTNGGGENSVNNQNNQINQGKNSGTNNQGNTINQGNNNGSNKQNNQEAITNNNQNQNGNQNNNINQNNNQNQNGGNMISTQPGTFGNNYGGGYGPWNNNLNYNYQNGYDYNNNYQNGYGYNNNQNGYGNNNQNDYRYNNGFGNNGGNYFNYIQNNGVRQTLDEYDRYSRPCPVYDTNCIRKFFAAHSKCKITYDPIPDPLFRAFNNLYFPALNITASQIGVTYTGQKTNIEEFFVDKETKEVVLQIRFRNLNLASTIDYYRFQRDGKEAAITTSNSIANFPNFSVTTVFRDYEHLDLAKSETVGYVDAIPAVFFNPTAGVHPDPTVAVMFANFLANPLTVVQESILTVAPYFAGYFVQYNICDFGLKLF